MSRKKLFLFFTRFVDSFTLSCTLITFQLRNISKNDLLNTPKIYDFQLEATTFFDDIKIHDVEDPNTPSGRNQVHTVQTQNKVTHQSKTNTLLTPYRIQKFIKYACLSTPHFPAQ